MQKGIARGIFSNEAGLGSAPIAAAAARTNEPVRQGLVSMTATFIDTIIICSITGIAIVLTGAYDMGLEGVAVTTKAFQMDFHSLMELLHLFLCYASYSLHLQLFLAGIIILSAALNTLLMVRRNASRHTDGYISSAYSLVLI